MRYQKIIFAFVFFFFTSAHAADEVWMANAGLSGVVNTGNSVGESFGGNALVSVLKDKNQISWSGNGAYSRTEDVATGISTTHTENWQTQLRYDRFLIEKLTLYGLTHMRHDAGAGIDLNYGGSVGYAHFLYKTDSSTFKYELGFDFTRQSPVNLDEVNAYSVRAFLQYTHKFTQGMFLGEDFENLFNVEDSEDYRINSLTSLNFNVTQKVAFQVGYVIRFDNQPNAGFKETDTMTQVGINISFL